MFKENQMYSCLDCIFDTNSIEEMNDHIDEYHNENYGEEKTPE